MDVRLRERWDELRGSYWFVPTLMIIGATLLWGALGAADQALYESGVVHLPWLYYDTIDSARTLMFAVAGAMSKRLAESASSMCCGFQPSASS